MSRDSDFITGDVDVNHFVKVVSTRFLQCKVTIFPSVISIYLVERYFETMQMPYFCIRFCLQLLVLWCLAKSVSFLLFLLH